MPKKNYESRITFGDISNLIEPNEVERVGAAVLRRYPSEGTIHKGKSKKYDYYNKEYRKVSVEIIIDSSKKIRSLVDIGYYYKETYQLVKEFKGRENEHCDLNKLPHYLVHFNIALVSKGFYLANTNLVPDKTRIKGEWPYILNLQGEQALSGDLYKKIVSASK